MSDNVMAQKAPVHLWIVGIVSLLWNSFGGFDYVMTQSRNAEYLAQFTDEQRAYFEGFPLWMDVVWALGVWGAVAGSILLLMKSRHAVTAFTLSLLGLALSHVYQLAGPTPPPMPEAAKYMTVMIWAGALAFLYYAWRQRKAGVLR